MTKHKQIDPRAVNVVTPSRLTSNYTAINYTALNYTTLNYPADSYSSRPVPGVPL